MSKILNALTEKTNSLGVKVSRPNQELIIIRGISGGGKSTKAKSLVGDGVIHSTDSLIEQTTNYDEFFRKMKEANNFSDLSRMHSLNLKNACKSLSEGISPVIIDNTNLRANEPKAYVKHALNIGLADENIKIVDIGTGGVDANVLFERNQHGVPLDKIQAMIQTHKSVGPLTLKKILESKDMYPESKILYSAVILDSESRNRLLTHFDKVIPANWNIFAHHMTIAFGSGVPMSNKSDIGKEFRLTVTHLGVSDMAMAVKVYGYSSRNPIAHITLATNPDGGLPRMSNDIINWQPVDSIDVWGVVTEIMK